MATARLTPNGVEATLAGDLNLKPVFQVLNLRSIAVNGPPGSAPRFRVVVSDGAATTTTLLASQLCDLALSGLVRRGTIVQLTEYLVNNVNGKKYVYPPPRSWIDGLRAVWWGCASLLGFRTFHLCICSCTKCEMSGLFCLFAPPSGLVLMNLAVDSILI
jgi:hypothetical protein